MTSTTLPLPPSAISTTATTTSAEQPSFSTFQREVEEKVQAETRARHVDHLKAKSIADKMNALKLGKGGKPSTVIASETATDEPIVEDDDGRTVQERLCALSSSDSASIAALILRSVDRNAGELILCLAKHNLQSRSIATIFDSPEADVVDKATTVGETSIVKEEDQEEFKLVPAAISNLLAALVQIGTQINCIATILYNPYTITGELSPATESDQPITASSNSLAIQARFSAKSLRILVRRKPEGAASLIEIRVAVVGNVDAGKSTLLGVLTKAKLDDGKGKLRSALFNHPHEMLTGRTSSVGMELMGFDPQGKQVQGGGDVITASGEVNERKSNLTWEQIAAQAAKLISFSDLAGHEKFLKTTLFGLTSSSPAFVLLIVGANAGLIGMSKEHLSVSLALSVPVVCIVTKVDMAPPLVLEATLKQLAKVLKSPGCRKTPVFVKDEGMACELARTFVAEKACPIFLVSNVTGTGLDLLKTFLNVVPSAPGNRFPIDDPLEFSISDVFSVPFTGTVVSGVILSGSVSVGDTVMIGPDTLGAFQSTVIKSIQRKRTPVNRGEAGQSVSFALKRIKRAAVRKGMVVLEKNDLSPPKAVRRFEGQVLILYHNTLIAPRYQAMLHVGSVRQTVQIESISDRPCIRTGDRATVVFRFIKNAEFVRVGERILFREGKTKAVGIISKCLE